MGRWHVPDPRAEVVSYMSPYAGIGNNPVNYIDPDGELFIIDDWILGFFKGFSRSLLGKHEKGHHTILGDAFASANRHAVNSAKIWGGLFAADRDRSGWGWQIISRFYRQTPQTFMGFYGAHYENMFGQITEVDYCEGATVVTAEYETVFFGRAAGYSLGSYIVGGNDLEARVTNALFQHEFGHYVQSQDAGWLYLTKFAIPSAWMVITGHYHLSHPVEQDAQARAAIYFMKYVDGFDFNKDWRYKEHPFYDRYGGNKVTKSTVTKDFLFDKLMRPNEKYISFKRLIGGTTPLYTQYKQ